jgi:hypothetical protein
MITPRTFLTMAKEAVIQTGTPFYDKKKERKWKKR